MSSIKKNYSYNVLYQILIMILPLVTIPYISRVLGPSGIGVFSYTQSIANYFLLFAMLGLKNYGNRTIAMVRDDKEKLSNTFWNIYGLQLIVSTTFILMYLLFIVVFEQKYLVISLIQTLFVLQSIFDINWFFFGLEKFKLTVTRNAIIKILSVCCVFLFVRTEDDLLLYTVIMSAGMLLSQLAVWPFVSKYVHFVRISWKEMFSHLKPNLVLFIPVLAVSLYKIMDKVMLGSISEIAQVGFYENTEKIINVPMGLIVSLGAVMLPRMSNLVAKGEVNQSKLYIKNSMTFVMFLSSALAFGIAGIAPIFAPFFFGKEFAVTGQLITYIAPTILFISWANVIRTQYLIPNKMDKVYIISVILGAVVNLVLNLLLIPNFGALGAVLGTILAEFTVAFVQTIMVRKELDFILYMKNGFPFLLFGIIMFIIVRICGNIEFSSIIILALQIAIGAIVYLTFSLTYLIITKNQMTIDLLSKVINRGNSKHDKIR